jgi:hypothetical protein
MGMVRHAPYGGTRVLYGRRLAGFDSLASKRSAALWAGARVKEQQSQNYRHKDRPRNPIPFEKNTNILQANSAWPRSFQIGKTLEVATRGCRNKV